jgi:hypothetical protein
MRTHIFKGSFAVVVAALAIMTTPALSQAGVKNFMTVINGAQETPPSGTAALGNGILTYDTATNTLCFYIVHDGTVVGGEIAAHIHGPATPGVGPAPVVVTLPVGNSKTGCVVAPPAPFNKADLFKNLYYVNIHSNFLPGGEIRGQIFRIK